MSFSLRVASLNLFTKSLVVAAFVPSGAFALIKTRPGSLSGKNSTPSPLALNRYIGSITKNTVITSDKNLWFKARFTVFI